MTLPALFIAHGSPTLVIEDNNYTAFLRELGASLPVPKGIALFSAHYDEPVQSLSVDEFHTTMHDFYGFPKEMYKIEYPAPGDPELSMRIGQLMAAQNLPYKLVTGRGLDHGAWVILRHMYPEANIPVVSLSVDSMRSEQEQYRIGCMLEPLRHEDILVIGSGGLVHNLRKLSPDSEPAAWAAEFDEWLTLKLEEWNLRDLYDYEKKAPNAQDAVPSYASEHFAPLFYAMGAADKERRAQKRFQAYQYGSLSLNCWQFG
ncbi:DODA-type extradiol aromatic ring-opening family dioxygenase [Paenibacillus shunpengii]|uniref:DODA-type extradiol aromatic ring-opening family dioxygenase n=1 Tax=Paenibacillus shunpengii TaxID=2054424 RepID=A0ABW5SHX8_9BACL|nr:MULTISPECIES: class III extradiol ring-cleavage dioxygenase [unclassified Paenibacillus]OMC72372.1 dioxygenase [Paenibacillus sp. FSL H7-0326]GAK41733.1 extradiol ring-cleavage dioxygenase class III protein subunit B [Paenibacillus sp. TCA20]